MNFQRTVLYTGITNNLHARIIEHFLEKGRQTTFTGRYNAYWLVYYEKYDSIQDAIVREKTIKGWSRPKKLSLIRSMNPELQFLNAELFGKWPPDDSMLVLARKE